MDYSELQSSPLKSLFTLVFYHGFLGILKSAIPPILKLMDSGLYLADIYSDVAYTNLLYQNCHFKYFAASVATLLHG